MEGGEVVTKKMKQKEDGSGRPRRAAKAAKV